MSPPVRRRNSENLFSIASKVSSTFPAEVWFQTRLPVAKRFPRGFPANAEARHTPRRPCGLSCGLGVTGRMLFWIPDQNNARRFSGFQPGARFTRRSGRMRLAGEGSATPPRRPHPGKLGEVLFSLITKSFVHLFKGGGVEGRSPRRNAQSRMMVLAFATMIRVDTSAIKNAPK